MLADAFDDVMRWIIAIIIVVVLAIAMAKNWSRSQINAIGKFIGFALCMVICTIYGIRIICTSGAAIVGVIFLLIFWVPVLLFWWFTRNKY